MFSMEDLCQLTVFDALTDAQRQSLARHVGDLHLTPGEAAMHEGDAAALFVVISGGLDVVKLVDGIERKIGTRSPGQIHGEVPLVFGTRFQSGARASTPTRLLQVDARAYYELAADCPAFANQMRLMAQERIGGLQGIAAETRKPQATVTGDPLDDRSLTLRRFLDRNGMTFDWLPPDQTARWPGEALAPGDLPAILCPDGTTLRRPPLRDLAEKMGLQTRPRHEVYDTVIIGGGPAGLAAAVYGASEGLRTLVVEREAPGGQAGTSSRIENYLGFPGGISGEELSDRAHRQARRLGAEILVTRQTVGIDPGKMVLRLDGDESVRARTAVIATGVSWRRVAVDGFDRLVGKGVYYGTSRSDVVLAQGADVHLIGAGNSAGQAALYMARHARCVTLVVRGDSLEKSMSQYLVDQVRSKQNIVCALRSEVTAVDGVHQVESVAIRNAVTGETRQVASSGVFVFIGADAETDWLPREIRRDARGYVLTGTDMPRDGAWPLDRDPYLLETSVPGIFACGDVRFSPVKRVAAAVGDGSMAIAFIHQFLAAQSRGTASG